MPNLLKSFRKTLEDTGVVGNAFTFLLFVFMWCLGATCGLLLLIIGMNRDEIVKREESELEKMIAKMNEEGPNN